MNQRSITSKIKILHIRFDKELRKDKNLQKRYVYLVLCCVCIAASSWGYSFFGLAFINVPKDYQFIIGLLVPLIREFYVWLLTQTAYKATGKGGLRITDIACSHYMETRHCLFLGKKEDKISK